jgi:4-amino-4-deoxy-L-arabinose transferase-like glycosyltransferase
MFYSLQLLKMLDNQVKILKLYKWWLIGLLLIVALASILRYPAYNFGYPYIDHPDEPHYALAAHSIINTGTAKGWQMDGYPPGIIFTDIMFLKAFQNKELPPTSIIPKIRLLSITFSIAAIITIAFIGMVIGAPVVGLIAALCYAISPICVEYDRYAAAEPFLTFFISLAFLFIFIAYKHSSHKIMIFAYLSSFIAIVFKYPAGLLFIPVIATDLMICLKLRRNNRLIPSDFYFGIPLRTLLCLGFFIWLFMGYGVIGDGKSSGPDRSWRRHLKYDFPDTLKIFHNSVFITGSFSSPVNLTEMGLTGNPPEPGGNALPYFIFLFAFAGFIISLVKNKKLFTFPYLVLEGFIIIWFVALNLFSPAYRHFISVLPVLYLLAVAGFSETLTFIMDKLFPKIVHMTKMILVFIVLIFILSNFFISSWTNMIERSKHDIRNEITKWMDFSLKGGSFISDPKCLSIFMPYSDYQGKKGFKWCGNIEERNLENEFTLKTKTIGIDYLIVEENQYDRAKLCNNYLNALPLLKKFHSKHTYYGGNYVVLSTNQIINKSSQKLDNVLILGYNSNISKLDEGNLLKLNIFWKAELPFHRPMSAFVYVKKGNNVLNFITFPPINDRYERRSTVDWNDPDEIIISDDVIIAFANKAKGKFTIYAGFCPKEDKNPDILKLNAVKLLEYESDLDEDEIQIGH